MKGELNPQLSFGDEALFSRVPEGHVLARLERELDWRPLEALLDGVYAPLGRGSAPPLACFRMLLLERWYGLSDAACEAACRDRLSFMRFLGLGLSDAVPDASTVSRFRVRLQDAQLEERLHSMVEAQLHARKLVVRPGVLLDATLVSSDDAASILALEAGTRPLRRRRRSVARSRTGLRAWWSVLRHKLRRFVS